jgi:hypothetical protein
VGAVALTTGAAHAQESADPPAAVAAPPALSKTEFDQVSAVLARNHDLFQGGSGQPVTFDSKTARERRLPERVIVIAEEMAALSNELVQAGTSAPPSGGVDVREVEVDERKYKNLTRFFEAAGSNRRELSERGGNEATAPPIPGSHAVCGYFPNPKPARAVPSRTFQRSNPAQTLRSLGYHETPSHAGGAWTRPQTYKPVFCGWSTYRDHAGISGRTTLWEQNYRGSPGGEPNPEVWRSGPWPYPEWPAYVRWWHSRY